MRILATSAAMIAGAMLASPLLAQSTPPQLSDLIGARGSSGESELQARGYRNVKTERSGDSIYSYWWNASRRQCITVRTAQGRYASIVSTLPADCGMSAGPGGGNAGGGGQAGLPGGSWSRSCTGGQMNRSILSARCDNGSGRRVYSEINMRQCPSGNVSNNNGRLTCIAGGGGQAGLPGGSWSRSCTGGQMNRSILSARCDNGSGRRVYSEINMRQCPSGNVSNNYGRLTCIGGSAGQGNPPPPGSWAQSCRNSSMRGSVLYATCDNGNGRWVPAQINVRQCISGRVKNDYGRLICE